MDFSKITSLENEHQHFLSRSDELYDIVTEIRFEPQDIFQKKIAAVKKLLGDFQSNLIPHMEAEEVILAFLEAHVPRLESVIRLLRAEHRELKVNLEVLGFLLEELEKEREVGKRDQTIENIKEKVVYFLYLLRNHIQVEKESVYRVAHHDLRADEKEILRKRLEDAAKKGKE